MKPALYDRAGGIYQDETGSDWSDNAARFALLNRVAALVAEGVVMDDWRPHVVHSNDWHAALVPYLLSTTSGARSATVLTIHNLAYQGLFDAEDFSRIQLPDDEQSYSSLEFYGRLSFLKAGIKHADALTTVSPTYSREILTAEYGCGLDGLLRERSDALTGILNGIDDAAWSPQTDEHIARRYSTRNLAAKRECKIALQHDFGLAVSTNTPVIGYMSRLCHQKMPDVVLEALPRLLQRGAQFVLVAQGDSQCEARFGSFAASHPEQVAVQIPYREEAAHRLVAGADMLLHPARYEPCGLTQMYTMQYGAVPIVRKTGGLADTVVDEGPQATGFSFTDQCVEAFLACAERALEAYRQPLAWRKLQLAGMKQDFGWRRSARAYVDLYRQVADLPMEQPPRFVGATDARLTA